MSLVLLRFFESVPSALAVGLLLLPMLIGEDGARFKRVIAALAAVRAVLGFFLVAFIARVIIPAERPIDFSSLVDFTFGTVVGKAWAGTQVLAILFAVLAAARNFVASDLLDKITLGVGVAVIAVVSVTGHAIDDSFAWWQQTSFLLHTGAGLTWLGGLLGLVWWMLTARNKPPGAAHKLAERWSTVAKSAMVIVLISGVVMAYENVGSFANLLATPYGRLLTLKLAFLCAVLLLALALVRYNLRSNSQTVFDTGWYAKIGKIESAFGLALLFVAGWIAVITPASHENDLYWPLPFRLSWDATWGQKPPMFSPIWWWGVSGLALALAAAVIWWTPALRGRRRIATPAAAALGALCVAVSFGTEAYTDTYNDPLVDYTAESVARGQTAFADYCTGCHGAHGEGNGPMAKDLKNAQGVVVPAADLTAPHVGTHTIGDIFHWLTFGGQSGVMPSFREQLQPDDRWDVINFLLMMSYSNRARFMSGQGMVQWLVAPDFALIDPEDQITALYKLRGKPTLVSFARCAPQTGDALAELEASLAIAAESVKGSGAHHVTVYDKACPDKVRGWQPSHPKAAESAFSVINRYPNEAPSLEIGEAHFLIDRSGYVRARFRRFASDDANKAQLRAQIEMMHKEPLVTINLHSH